MIYFNAIPANEGDALWIEWQDGDKTQRMLVDMGRETTGRAIHARIAELPEAERALELLVITHVDRDHIAGALTGLIDNTVLPGLEFRDIWFNGRLHLSNNTVPYPDEGLAVESFGAVQGEKLTEWLKDRSWNKAFGRGAVCRYPDGDIETVELPGSMQVSVIGPTLDRLENLIPRWDTEIRKACEKEKALSAPPAGFEAMGRGGLPPEIEAFGRGVRPTLLTEQDLIVLAHEHANKTDDSEPNGSSIAIVLDHRGKRILLAGDAFPEDLIRGIEVYKSAKGLPEGEPLPLDLFKIPHHGSLKNLSMDLVKAVDCKKWLISTSGAYFKHPDAGAVARIIHGAHNKPAHICFNVPSTYNSWWDNEEWQQQFCYQTIYGDEQNGLELQI